MRKVKALVIDVSDVLEESMRSTVGHRSKATNSSRSNSVTGMKVTLKHRQTGVAVKGEVPEGSYSRGTFRRLVGDLRAKLLIELNVAVARKLRLPGR